MTTIPLREAQSTLAELIRRLAPGEEVILTEGDRPVARLMPLPASEAPRPVPGRCRGMLTILREDDDHLEDWAEYLP